MQILLHPQWTRPIARVKSVMKDPIHVILSEDFMRPRFSTAHENGPFAVSLRSLWFLTEDTEGSIFMAAKNLIGPLFQSQILRFAQNGMNRRPLFQQHAKRIAVRALSGAVLVLLLAAPGPLGGAGILSALARSAPPSAGQCTTLEACVQGFEASYRGVRTLHASFTQNYSAWGRTRVESGQVILARGGKMRWDYEKPESKLFLSDGKEVLLWVPAEKQLTRTPLKESADVRVPLDLLVSHMNLRRAFSKIEFADSAGAADPSDRVLRAYPRRGYDQEYRDVLVEITPTFDIRRLVVTYPDETQMEFTFEGIKRNAAVNPGMFSFTPPAGTEVIQQ